MGERKEKEKIAVFQRVTNITTYIFINRFHTKIVSPCVKKKDVSNLLRSGINMNC